MFGGIGTPELLLILVLAFMIFGVGKLPQVAKMLGSGVNNFKKGLSGEDEDDEAEKKDDQKDEPELLEEEKAAAPAATEKQRKAEPSKNW